jgi:hypothetical protein
MYNMPHISEGVLVIIFLLLFVAFCFNIFLIYCIIHTKNNSRKIIEKVDDVDMLIQYYFIKTGIKLPKDKKLLYDEVIIEKRKQKQLIIKE